MSEELQKQLAAFLGAMLEAMKSGGELAAGQMPLLVQEKILLGRAWHTLAVVLGIVLTPLLIRWAVRNFTLMLEINKEKGNRWLNDEEIWPFFKGILSVGGVLGFGIAGAANVFDCLMVWFAPRLYIIEWLTGMVK